MECFRDYFDMIKNRLHGTMETLLVDHGREYYNQRNGVELEVTERQISEQDGGFDREPRTVVGSTTSMLYGKDLPNNYGMM